MEPACSLAVPSLFGAEKGASGLVGEKQLFEKFWKGTFKAVATPRLESVIIASIKARTRVADATMAACQSLEIEERKTVKLDATKTKNGHVKRRGHKRHRRHRSPSYDEDLSPRPKGKKKKRRKSQRKRKRKRSPSYSLSPVRKKKKKKKKSAKKNKRHRYTSKKSKHSSSSLRHKGKNEQRQKKSSRSHGRRKHRYHRSPSEASSCQSSSEDRRHLQKSEVQQVFGDLGKTEWRSPPASGTTPKYHSVLSAHSILSSKSGRNQLEEKQNGLILRRREEAPHDYDSGNDTSSPPSCKTAVSERKRGHAAAFPDKHKFTDIGSDSGNSVTSYASLCKTYRGDSLSTSVLSPGGKREQTSLGCGPEESVRSCCSHRSRRRSRSHRSRTLSRRSSTSSRHSRCISLSSYSSHSRSPSSSSSQWHRDSSRGSSCRHSADRSRDRRRTSTSRESKESHSHKKRRRRKSYSPMKKRRRDSPSHLEARRITSARKRPVPYFRRSPSSSRCSASSWSSLFSRSRSRSAPYRASRSPSYSSYRSYSRSSSLNSIFSTRSRSRSWSRSRGKTHKCCRRKRH